MWTKEDVSSFVDLTTLNSYDSPKSVEEFLNQALEFKQKGFQVAAVCLYPNFGAKAKGMLKNSGIKVAVVAGSFPSSQSFLSTKLNECELALEAGVDEIDIVLNLGEFDDGNYTHVVDEIRAFKGLMPDKVLKVILETGYLKTPERIEKASELAITGGADFIKTSTGKEFPGADLMAAEVMAKTIVKQKAEKKVGLKISGGVRTYEDALEYLNFISGIIGNEYITPDKFRIGASSLMKNLVNG